MPTPTFGLSRPASTPGVFGLPSSTPPIIPVRARQAVQANATSATLPSLPLEGSLLIAAVSGNPNNSALGSVSGGGVSWTLLANVGIYSTNNLGCHVWYGVVGATPSTSVSAALPANTYNIGVVEFAGYGATLLASTSGSSASSSLNLSLPSTKKGLLLAVIAGYGTTTGPTGSMATDVSISGTSRGLLILHGYTRYPGGNQPLTISAGGASGKTAAAVGIFGLA